MKNDKINKVEEDKLNKSEEENEIETYEKVEIKKQLAKLKNKIRCERNNMTFEECEKRFNEIRDLEDRLED